MPGRQLDLVPDDTMFGTALSIGRLVATIVSGRTGDHITVQAKCKRRLPTGRWALCPFTECEKVYLDTPRPDGQSGNYIGMYVRERGVFYPGRDADVARAWAGEFALRVAGGQPVPPSATILLGTNCLMCGRDLTDPVSIEANIGPECRKKIGLPGHNGHHHVIERKAPPEPLPGTVEIEDEAQIPGEGEAQRILWEIRHDIEHQPGLGFSHNADFTRHTEDEADEAKPPLPSPGLFTLAPGQDPKEVTL